VILIEFNEALEEIYNEKKSMKNPPKYLEKVKRMLMLEKIIEC
jgi:hypothetical protein